jgi:hypothetical protein
MIRYKNNFQIAVKALTDARSDHYDGINAIYRLPACVPIPEGSSSDGIRRQIQKLIKDLVKLSVRPNRIIIHDDMIEIDWYPKGYQMVMNRGQYAGLLLEFAKFLNAAPIRDLLIQDGYFGDAPEDSVRSVNNDQVNFFPEFNSKYFGATDREPIEVIVCGTFDVNVFAVTFWEGAPVQVVIPYTISSNQLSVNEILNERQIGFRGTKFHYPAVSRLQR